MFAGVVVALGLECGRKEVVLFVLAAEGEGILATAKEGAWEGIAVQ